MALISTQNHLAFIFGILGNIASFVVFLAPLPTFIRICKRKSTEGFGVLPYSAGLFSAMLWLYYATLKSDVFLLVTINSFGCFIETIYLGLFIAYAPKQVRMSALRLILLLNLGAFCAILLLAHFMPEGDTRVKVLGGICTGFAVSVFAAPLSIMRTVIRTKSVEFMPFNLSFVLTISAVMWFIYGLSLKDLYIACPNVLGFIFGVVQMILYCVYKNYNKTRQVTKGEIETVPNHTIDMEKLSTMVNPDAPQPAAVCPHPIVPTAEIEVETARESRN